MVDENLNQEPQPEAESPTEKEQPVEVKETKEEPSEPVEQPTEAPATEQSTEAQPAQPTGGIKKRNPVMVLLLGLVTFAIYWIIWIFKTTKEMKGLGAQIPTPILFFIPGINYYFMWKYCAGYAKFVKKDNQTLVWFLVWLFVFPVGIFLFQKELNKHAQ